MNKHFYLLFIILVLLASVTSVFADRWGDFEYKDYHNTIVIEKYFGFESQVDVPGSITGKIVTGINNKAFNENNDLVSISLPDSIQTIGYKAFSKCRNLETIHFSSGLKHIGYSAFSECSSLESVMIPDSVEYIDDYAFWNCINLKEIKLSESLLEIGNSAFSGCKYLEEVIFPPNIRKIGSYAFSNCKITSLFIPDSLRDLGEGAFIGCKALKKISMTDQTYIRPAIFLGCDLLEELTLRKTENATLAIENDALIYLPEHALIAYLGFEQTPHYTISLDVKEISREAFSRCKGVRRITIPEGVEKIGEFAFGECENLEHIIFPKSINYIGGRLFAAKAFNLKLEFEQNSYAHKQLSKLKIIKPEYDFGIRSDGTASVIRYNCQFENTRVPTHYEGRPITGIAENAFSGCDILQSVWLPDAIDTIGNFAFSDCIALTSIKLPSNLVFIGDNAFENCLALTSIVLPEGLYSIGSQAFLKCFSLSDVKIPSSVSEFGLVSPFPYSIKLIVERDSFAKKWAEDKGYYYTYEDANDWLNL